MGGKKGAPGIPQGPPKDPKSIKSWSKVGPKVFNTNPKKLGCSPPWILENSVLAAARVVFSLFQWFPKKQQMVPTLSPNGSRVAQKKRLQMVLQKTIKNNIKKMSKM